MICFFDPITDKCIGYSIDQEPPDMVFPINPDVCVDGFYNLPDSFDPRLRSASDLLPFVVRVNRKHDQHI